MARLRPLVRAILIPVVAIAAAVALGSWASGRAPDTRSPLTASLDALPAQTLVAGFTDWAQIRHELRVGSGSTVTARDALGAASLRDLSTRSVLGGTIGLMHATYGWSAADLEWESYGQSPSGAAMVARLSGSISIDEIQKRLRKLGYSRDGDVWTLSAAGSTRVGTELAATLGHLGFVPRERLVVAADQAAFVPVVLATISGRDASMLTRRPVADIASVLKGSTTAVIQAGSFGCRATSLDEGGPAVRAQADAALARAGALATPTFTGRGLTGVSEKAALRFAAAFGSPAQATSQLSIRTALASGPFIGRSGQIGDTLTLDDATAVGSVATLSFTTDPERAAYMSGEGPLLFASCP